MDEIVFIMDRSGSMGMEEKADEAVSGFNTFVKEQREIGEARLTLVLFNTEVKTPIFGEPIQKAPLVKKHSGGGMLSTKTQAKDGSVIYLPSGMTALHDAVGSTIDQVGTRLDALDEDKKPERVIVPILTDGLENSSLHFTKSNVRRRIEHQQSVYNWNFIFLGVGIDGFATGTELGVHEDRTMSFEDTKVGTQRAYAAASEISSSLRSSNDQQ